MKRNCQSPSLPVASKPQVNLYVQHHTCLSLIEIAHKLFAFLNCSKYPDIEEGEEHHGNNIEEDDNL